MHAIIECVDFVVTGCGNIGKLIEVMYPLKYLPEPLHRQSFARTRKPLGRGGEGIKQGIGSLAGKQCKQKMSARLLPFLDTTEGIESPRNDRIQ